MEKIDPYKIARSLIYERQFLAESKPSQLMWLVGLLVDWHGCDGNHFNQSSAFRMPPHFRCEKVAVLV